MTTQAAIIVSSIILGLCVIYSSYEQRFQAIYLADGLVMVLNKGTGETQGCHPQRDTKGFYFECYLPGKKSTIDQ